MTDNRENKNRGGLRTALLILALIVIAGIFAAVYRFAVPKGNSGEKTITVSAVLADGSSEEFTIRTSAANLRAACEEAGLISGREGEYGMYVTTVNGVAADESKQEWWRITKDGEMVNTSVDSTVIADGEHYEFTLTAGW